VTDCDRLAADAAAPDRIEGIKGVQSGQINIDFALPACLSATKAYPTELRLAYQLGRVLFAAYRFEEARKVLVDAAEMGNSAAKDLLGTMYLYGEGVAKDEAEAVRLYRQAADLGNAHAIRLDVCEERPGRCQGRCRSRAALSPGGGLRPCRRHE
jgi:TPR repeat protein